MTQIPEIEISSEVILTIKDSMWTGLKTTVIDIGANHNQNGCYVWVSLPNGDQLRLRYPDDVKILEKGGDKMKKTNEHKNDKNKVQRQLIVSISTQTDKKGNHAGLIVHRLSTKDASLILLRTANKEGDQGFSLLYEFESAIVTYDDIKEALQSTRRGFRRFETLQEQGYTIKTFGDCVFLLKLMYNVTKFYKDAKDGLVEATKEITTEIQGLDKWFAEAMAK